MNIHAGQGINCARTRNRLVYCWGAVAGQAYVTELVRSADGVPLEAVALSGGQNHACALRADSTLVCWGDDAYDQLGSAEVPSARNRYVQVPLSDVRAVACGDGHTCALLGDGSVQCWGSNAQGGLGSGDPQNSPTPIPVLMHGLPPARAIYAGASSASTCMEVQTGQVYCWGFGYYGQLGTGTMGVHGVVAPDEITQWP